MLSINGLVHECESVHESPVVHRLDVKRILPKLR